MELIYRTFLSDFSWKSVSTTDAHLNNTSYESWNTHLKQTIYAFNYLPTQTRSYHLFFLSLHFVCVCVHMLSHSVGLTLGDPTYCSPPGSSVHGIFQTRILEWIAISSSRGSSQPKDQTCIYWVSCTGKRILYHSTTGKPS